jgi:hypothetical protein
METREAGVTAWADVLDRVIPLLRDAKKDCEVDYGPMAWARSIRPSVCLPRRGGRVSAIETGAILQRASAQNEWPERGTPRGGFHRCPEMVAEWRKERNCVRARAGHRR